MNFLFLFTSSLLFFSNFPSPSHRPPKLPPNTTDKTPPFLQDSIHTCPPLDILLVGGPPPTYTPSPAICTFLRAQHSHVSAFLTICTGFLAPLHAGLLHNVRSTAPRGLLENLKKEHKDVKWEEKRWVRDGKMWSSGAIMNGFEMMGEFMRERWGGVGGEKEGKGEGALVGFVKEMSDFPRRGVDY